jgi:hypothetical protein
MTTDRERPRRTRITLRFTADERRALDSAARRAGLCLSAFIRLALLRARPPRAARRPSVESTLLAAVLSRLGAIATDLHQIAKAISTPGAAVMPTVERELLACLASLRTACRDLLRALGRKPVAS